MEESRLVKRLYSESGISLKMTDRWQDPIFPGLDEEDLRSFMLTARLLTQSNDRISIRRITASLETLQDNDPRRVAAHAAKWKLNDYLDQEAPFVDSEGVSHTNRDILEAFLYGFYAHTSEPHEATLDRWAKEPKTFFPFKLLFLAALRLLYETAVDIKAQLETS